ncbi:CBS domain-containing protein [Streptomyces sp. B1I3]|uniref:CBS domain-containing protein n=1 Tax=Streptomyces sp. B1I3 TaxID=3042264 RepID=UPI00277E064E|nr:CBS domain-containing protein [Streptomyces sp. B1I3]MDQ0793441.1 CBS domain-containing protein [Streptomyces sp. B1I3]
MTPAQTQPRSTSATAVPMTVADAMDNAGPQVCDDMTVEVALSVMASARTGHLLVCDDSGLCTGLVTRAQLTAARDGSAYSDRAQLRDILGDRGPFTSPVTTMAEARHMMRYSHVEALPVVDEHGSALGLLVHAR